MRNLFLLGIASFLVSACGPTYTGDNVSVTAPPDITTASVSNVYGTWMASEKKSDHLTYYYTLKVESGNITLTTTCDTGSSSPLNVSVSSAAKITDSSITFYDKKFNSVGDSRNAANYCEAKSERIYMTYSIAGDVLNLVSYKGSQKYNRISQ